MSSSENRQNDSSKNQIPNLLSSSRFARNKKPISTRNQASNAADNDKIIQQTDDDAAGSRLSAVEKGYLRDDFAAAVAAGGGGVRRMPIINRGTYVRTRSIDRIIERFLSKTSTSNVESSAPSTPTQTQPSTRIEKRQIISLGAGTDTRPFRLFSRNPSLAETLHYHELDFAATTSAKVSTIQRTPSLDDIISASGAYTVSDDRASLSSPCYTIAALDLRDLTTATAPQHSSSSKSPLPPPSSRNQAPTTAPMSLLPRLSSTAPTLILSECCLAYLPASSSTGVLRSLVHALHSSPHVEIVAYEPLSPSDAFGRTMVANLAARGIDMPGMTAFPTLDNHARRMKAVLSTSDRDDGGGDDDAVVQNGQNETGVDRAEVDVQGWTTKQIWDKWVTREEKERLRRCEMVDEEEEWMLLAEHYGVVWARRRLDGRETESEASEAASDQLVIDSGG